ncbi:MAG TPA: MFS transporter [Ignavibacteria bacterium]|nr:MFS transporter [Ignavibacteria bacterium]HMQ99415.1 MFS transporter [Ignavibacteria bacterium]
MKKIESPSKILLVLTLIEFINYFDRQVVFPLFSFLKTDFGLSDFELGLIGTVFMIIHASFSVPLGILADKWVRKNIIAMGVAIWSVATFITGLVQNFTQLLFTRAAVGIGEASYAPAATSLIADNFPLEKRARASSIFHLGMFFGGTLGMILAGVLGSKLGWRACFFIVAIPGIILALTSLRIKEVKHEHKNTSEVNRTNILQLFKNPAYILTLLSGIMLTFTSSAIISWMTQFFIRFHNYSVDQASITIGLAVIIGGPIGIYSGGYFSDLLYNKYKKPRSLAMAIAFILATPLMYITLTTHNEILLLITLVLATYLMTFYYGPMVALIQDIVPGSLKATAFAFYLFTVHLIGSTPAPALIGIVSDASDLQKAMFLVVASNLIGGIMLLVTSRYLIKERLKTQNL